MRKRNIYTIHRWLGLLVSLQLLAWSIGGFAFSILDIDDVHGDLERSFDPPSPIRFDRVGLSPAEAVAAACATGPAERSPVRVSLREGFEGPVYELYNADGLPVAVVDAETGRGTSRITKEQAARAALADFAPDAGVASVEFLEGDAPSEYRGRPMPVYRVILDHSKEPHIYVCSVTGRVLARRNKPWRIFDFFWMLHIMDYGGRENLNHWLLTTMSILAVLTSASGFVLWFLRLPRWKRGRGRAAVDSAPSPR